MEDIRTAELKGGLLMHNNFLLLYEVLLWEILQRKTVLYDDFSSINLKAHSLYIVHCCDFKYLSSCIHENMLIYLMINSNSLNNIY